MDTDSNDSDSNALALSDVVPYTTTARTKGVAPAGLALTCLAFGLTTPCAFGFLSGIPGILFGVWALRCTPPERWGLRWVTYAGIAVSVIGTLVTTIGLFSPAVR